MEIKVSQRDFDLVLKTSGVTLGTQDGLTSHFVFRKTEQGAEVLSYSGTLCSSTPLDRSTVTGTSTFTVDGKRLREWVSVVSSDDTVTLRFDEASRTVIGEDSHGTQRFESLDPKHYPYWDEKLAAATKTASVPAERLAEAFDHSVGFSSEKTNKAALHVIEARKGCLWASDGASLSRILLPQTEGMGIRVHCRNARALVRFLGLYKDSEVEVLETDSAYYIRTHDGAVFGETRFESQFPELDMKAEAHFWFTAERDALMRGIQWLRAGARKEDIQRVTVLPLSTGGIALQMDSAAGGRTAFPVPAADVHVEDGKEFPPCSIPVMYLTQILTGHSDATVKINGVKSNARAGFFFVQDTRFDSTFTTFAITQTGEE